MMKEDKLAYLYILALFSILLLSLQPGIAVTDEGTYLLMINSFVNRQRLDIPNDLENLHSAELLIPSTQFIVRDFDTFIPLEIWLENKRKGIYQGQIKAVGFSAPFYTYIGAVPYYALGLLGLSVLNTLCFIVSLLVLYKLFCLLADKKTALLSMVLYSLTFTISLSQMVWPHMVSILFVASSLYLLIFSYKKKGGFVPLFFSGIFSALSIGIRYPNAFFSILELMFIWFFFRKAMKNYLVGFIIPIIALGFVQQKQFGSFLETTYPAHSLVSVAPIAVGLFAVVAFLFKSVEGKAKFLPLPNRKHLLIIFFALLFASLFEPFRTILLNFYIRIFDSTFNMEVAEYDKKALLQSVPILSLFVFGLKRAYNDWEHPILCLFGLFALYQVMSHLTWYILMATI